MRRLDYMGAHHFPSSARCDGNESVSSLFGRSSPLSAARSSSPSPPIFAGTTPVNTPPTRTPRHIAVRLMFAPFTAVFRPKRSHAGASDVDDAKTGTEEHRDARGRRRPSLEQLLRMEASSCPDRKTTSPQGTVSSSSCGRKDQRAIVVFGIPGNAHPRIGCTVEEKAEQEPWSSLQKSHIVSTDDDDERQQMAIVPVKVQVDLAGPEATPAGGSVSAPASPAVSISASLRQTILQALRMDNTGRANTPTRRQYCKLARRGDSAGKAELFYQRPIPMGRRCRVQHLEDSPYA